MKSRLFLFAGVLLLATACDEQARQAQGFSLPDGDIASGKEAFARLGCAGCHAVEGIEQDADAEMSISLGGESTRIKTYGELVTSVINPSHRTARVWLSDETRTQGESRMQSYNEVMTVKELVDIVTFLQSRYTLPPHPRTQYREYRRQNQQGE